MPKITPNPRPGRREKEKGAGDHVTVEKVDELLDQIDEVLDEATIPQEDEGQE